MLQRKCLEQVSGLICPTLFHYVCPRVSNPLQRPRRPEEPSRCVTQWSYSDQKGPKQYVDYYRYLRTRNH